ncbi:hypothetical protein [Cesiribacter sp. SM1]|uniref:hypothetical protein n=1 Tax=Cesiribacter sp. SM1 TaxID=2861196 RepID=UPI001CD25FEB|nr:hypothetical protein [Cesiribacter sp. SM1]
MQKTEIDEAAQLLLQHGVFDQEALQKAPALTEAELRQLLARQVLYLLERDFERLLQSVYRIDVPEKRFKECLVSDDPAGQIADLMLKRELMKVETRRWYASRSGAASEN